MITPVKPPSHISGEDIPKINTFDGVLGRKMVENHSTPIMKRPRNSNGCNIANVAADLFRSRGLAAIQQRR